MYWKLGALVLTCLQNSIIFHFGETSGQPRVPPCYCRKIEECGGDGICTHGCQPGYFGQTCEYNDVTADPSVEVTGPSVVIDHNDSTCARGGLLGGSYYLTSSQHRTFIYMYISWKHQGPRHPHVYIFDSWKRPINAVPVRWSTDPSLSGRAVITRYIRYNTIIIRHLPRDVCSVEVSAECPRFFYGERCTTRCSRHCGGTGECDDVTGKCLYGCRHKQPPMCQKNCPNGWYGQNCELICSENCRGPKSCHVVTGACYYGCKHGYLPPLCVKEMDLQGAPKWFDKGRQRCNCENNTQCTEYGICPGPCAYGYIGINCQHLDAGLVDGVSVVAPPVVLDYDDTTCANDLQGGIYRMTSKHTMAFVFLYISWKTDESRFPKVHISERNGKSETMKNMIIQKVNKHTLLYRARRRVANNTYYNTVYIRDLPSDVCTVALSAGRNVALLMDTSQSNDASSHKYSKTAQEATDGYLGNTLSTSNGESCTQMKCSDFWWGITIRHVAVFINAVRIYKQGVLSCHSLCVRGLRQGARTWTHCGAGTYGRSSVMVTNHSAEASQVFIVIRPIDKEAGCSISLCEVQVFGDFSCSRDDFGYLCEKRCYQRDCADQCDTDWGCMDGCPFIPNYKCPCPGLFYGQKCEHRCSNTCPEECHHETGKCMRSHCHYRYGPECKYDCPKNCGGLGICDDVTGACTQGCKPGLYPPDCSQTCVEGKYEVNCSKVCDRCSRNGTTNQYMCDPVSGQCRHGCGPGFMGDTCEDIVIVNPLHSTVGKTMGSVFLLLFLLLVFYRGLTAKKEPSSFEEEHLAERRKNVRIQQEPSESEDDFDDESSVDPASPPRTYPIHRGPLARGPPLSPVHETPLGLPRNRSYQLRPLSSHATSTMLSSSSLSQVWTTTNSGQSTLDLQEGTSTASSKGEEDQRGQDSSKEIRFASPSFLIVKYS